jgi:hypothetical protein
MKHYSEEWLYEWCVENNWTDLYIERQQYWAFPPGAVIPEPIPPRVLRGIKAEKGLSEPEKLLSISAAIASIGAIVCTYLLQSPMPLALAFALGAVTVALLEVED